MKKALVVGATGLVGSNCLDQLLSDHSYSSVEIWVRNKTGKVHPKLIEKVIDFSQIYKQTYNEINHVFCCLGTTRYKAKTKEAYRRVDVMYVIELAKWSEANKIESFGVISSIGANRYAYAEYLQMKGDMEENVKLCNISTIGIFRPSLLLGNRNEFRLLEKISVGVYNIFKFLLVGSLRKFKGIQAADVAKALIKVAKQNKMGITIYESFQVQEIANNI
jgi:uncharacterized protein YbjT (DUF2867 family)